MGPAHETSSSSNDHTAELGHVVPGDEKARAITGFLSRFGSSKPAEPRPDPTVAPASADELVHPTKAVRKFLTVLRGRPSRVILDLGPVVGHNVTFLGEDLGCKIYVEDLFKDLDRHTREGRLDAFPGFLKARLTYADGTVDGVLCWDLFDYLDAPSALALAQRLTRLLRGGAPLLAFFRTAASRDAEYTKYIMVDDASLRYRRYPAARPPHAVLLNRDIIRLFEGLRVSDSFLMKTHVREILFRKPGD